MLAIRLPEDIENRLTELAKKTGRTKTFYAKEAILEHLDDMEDKYLALSRLENSGKPGTLSGLMPLQKNSVNSISKFNVIFFATSENALQPTMTLID